MSTKAEVTFATAAVGSPTSTATSNYRATAVFPWSHNVAVTCFYFSGSRTAYLEIVVTENVGVPYGL